MRTLLIFILMAILIGVVLSLSLPKPHTASINKPFRIHQTSLSSPFDMKDFLLITPTPSDSRFTLRLGLYSQLQQAVAAAESINAPSKTLIVKVMDNKRDWYLLLLGQYPTASKADLQIQWLKNNQTPATLMLLPTGLTL